MSLALDAYDILRRIGSNPELFAGLRGAVAEVAEELVKRELTAKSLDLETFRDFAEGTKKNCIVSRALAAVDMHVEAKLA